MGIITAIIHIMFISLIELFYLVGMLIAAGFLLGLLERISNRFLIQALGHKGVLITAWIGTPIHELGHLLMCFVWGHRVSRVRLLQLKSTDGILGFVEHQYNPNSLYQQIGNFFIGLGPLFSGIGSIILGMYLLVPHSYNAFISQIRQHITFETLDIRVLQTVGLAAMAIGKSLFTVHNLLSPGFWIFLIIAVSISSHIALSRADIEGSLQGFITIYFLLICVNIISNSLNLNSFNIIIHLSEYNAYVLTFVSIALMFSLFTLLISFLIYIIKRQ
jgi:hypothetical protein